MPLQEQIQQEIKAAMIAKDADRLSTLRLLKSAMGYAQIEKKTESLSDPEVTALIQKEVKKRRDSVEQYRNGGRPELAEKEEKEIVILEKFLPKPLEPGRARTDYQSHHPGNWRHQQKGNGPGHQSRSGQSCRQC